MSDIAKGSESSEKQSGKACFFESIKFEKQKKREKKAKVRTWNKRFMRISFKVSLSQYFNDLCFFQVILFVQ